jgi:sec-independent protein translocase protein TatA
VGFINVGPLEILVILVIALLVLGPARLPEAARAVGKGMREFRDSLSAGGSDDSPDDEEEPAAAGRA